MVVRVRCVEVASAVPPKTLRIGRVVPDAPQRIIVVGIRCLALLELDDVDGIFHVLSQIGVIDELED